MWKFEQLNKIHLKQKIIIVSTLAKEGAKETIQCLELGAFDFVTLTDLCSFLTTFADTISCNAFAAENPICFEVRKGGKYQIALSEEPPRNGLRPCADIMYESLVNTDFDDITCVVR